MFPALSDGAQTPAQKRKELRRKNRIIWREQRMQRRATNKARKRALLIPVAQRGLTSPSDTLPLRREARLKALNATPVGTVRIETCGSAAHANQTIKEFESAGWTVEDQTSSKQKFFFKGTDISVRFRKSAQPVNAKSDIEESSNEAQDGWNQSGGTLPGEVSVPEIGVADEITKLALLHQQGELTDDEFTSIKEGLINRLSDE